MKIYKTNRLLVMLSLADKIMKSNKESTFIKEHAPNLTEAFKHHLPELTKQYMLYKGIGRMRSMDE